MSFAGKVIITAVVAFFAVLGYAHFLASITPEEHARRILKDYEDWKRKEERKRKWKE